MVKISTNKVTARRHIFWQTLMWVTAIKAVVLTVLVFTFDVKNFWLLVGIILSGPFVTLLITELRMKWGDDSKILSQWNEQRRLKISNLKKQRMEVTEKMSNHYIISDIKPTGLCGEFKIYFDKVIREAMPRVYLNSKLMLIKSHDSKSITCHLRGMPNSEKISFSIGDNEWTGKNPYALELNHMKIKWQVKGHEDEKVILIDGSCLKNPFTGLNYDFYLKVNRKKYGPLHGRYVENEKVIRIPVGTVHSNCEQNRCTLIAIFNNDIHVTLPAPTVFSVNHQIRHVES